MTANNDTSTNSSGSSAPTNKTDELYETIATDAIPSVKPLDEPQLDVYNIETYCTDDYVVDVTWSPSGLSLSRGCILSSLTNQGDIHLFEHSNVTQSSKYIKSASLVGLLRNDFGTPNKNSLPRDHGIEDYIFQAFSWSSRVSSTNTTLNKWGSAFLAGGTKSGRIHIFQPYHVPQPENNTNDSSVQTHTNVRLFSTVSITQQGLSREDNWITHLKWSPWVKTTQDTKYLSHIVYTTASNLVMLKPVVFDTQTQQLDTSMPVRVLQQASRFTITSLWVHLHKHSQTFVAAVSQIPGISVFAFNTETILGTSLGSAPITNGNEIPCFFADTSMEKRSPIEKVCLFDRDENQVWVAGTANKYDTFLGVVTFSSDGDPSKIQFTDTDGPEPSASLLGATNILQTFVDRRTTLLNNKTTASSGIINDLNSTYCLQCLGFAPHPVSGDHLVFLFRKVAENELRYLLTSHEKFQVSFIPFVQENGKVVTTSVVETADRAENLIEQNGKGSGTETQVSTVADESITHKEIAIPDPDYIIQELPSILTCSSESTWWRIKALSNSIKKLKHRPLFIKALINKLGDYVDGYKQEVMYDASYADSYEFNTSDSGGNPFTSLLATLTSTFYFTKYYDVLRLLIHLKTVALQLQDFNKQARDREYQNITEMNNVYGISTPAQSSVLIFGQDIGYFEQDIDDHFQFIISELAFIVLVHVSNVLSKAQAEGETDGKKWVVSNVERAIILSYIVQLEKGLGQDGDTDIQDDSTSLKKNRANKPFLLFLLNNCKSLLLQNSSSHQPLRKDTDDDTLMTDASPAAPHSDWCLTLDGDGFSDVFDFKAAASCDEMFSEKGYPWRRCSLTLLPLMFYDTKTCAGCKRQTALLSSYYGNERESADKYLSVPYLLETLLGSDTFDACIYSGCRYTQTL